MPVLYQARSGVPSLTRAKRRTWSSAVLDPPASLTSVISGLVPERTGGPHVAVQTLTRPTCVLRAIAPLRRVHEAYGERTKERTAPRACDLRAAGHVDSSYVDRGIPGQHRG